MGERSLDREVDDLDEPFRDPGCDMPRLAISLFRCDCRNDLISRSMHECRNPTMNVIMGIRAVHTHIPQYRGGNAQSRDSITQRTVILAASRKTEVKRRKIFRSSAAAGWTCGPVESNGRIPHHDSVSRVSTHSVPAIAVCTCM